MFRTRLNNRGDTRYSCLVPDFNETAFSCFCHMSYFTKGCVATDLFIFNQKWLLNFIKCCFSISEMIT